METIVIKKPQSNMLRPLKWFFKRFHLLLFFILIVGCLAAAAILINDTLTNSSNQDFTSSINAGTIDQATLERIQSLRTSAEQQTPAPLPEGRSNPFTE